MKKTITLLSALIFSIALMVPSLIWADDGKHMEEGSKAEKSSHGEYKDKKHSKGEKGHKEGSAAKEEHDKSANHEKMEEGSKDGKKMKSPAPKREGS